MSKIILHIDFNSYFATVEQQANPRLRGKPVGVTGGDRKTRTVINAASIEAKKLGIKTPMQIWEAKKICPELILVTGDSDKYLFVTTKFLNILKDYSPNVEVFSIDEVFIEMPQNVIANECAPPRSGKYSWSEAIQVGSKHNLDCHVTSFLAMTKVAEEIKKRIKEEIGECMKVSIGISYNKLMAKMASNLQKPDGLVMIANEQEAMKVLSQASLDDVCGIGYAIKKRLGSMGVFNFRQLRALPLEFLLLEFKSYGNFLYNASRGIDHRPIVPFYEKEEVKSIGHRYTINHDTDNEVEIKQILLKLTELISRKLRAKKLVGKTVSCWFRLALNETNVIPTDEERGVEGSSQHSLGDKDSSTLVYPERSRRARNDNPVFIGDGMQITIPYTNDGLEIFNTAWKSFFQMWNGEKIRMVGTSISNLTSQTPQNLTFLEEDLKQEKILEALDKINDKFGEFTLQRGILLDSAKIRRMANSFLADRRFKL